MESKVWIDGSYSISMIQDYFKYILKKLEAVIYNPSVKYT